MSGDFRILRGPFRQPLLKGATLPDLGDVRYQPRANDPVVSANAWTGCTAPVTKARHRISPCPFSIRIFMLTKIHKFPATASSQIPLPAPSPDPGPGPGPGPKAPRRSRAIEKLARTYGVDGKQSPGKGELRRSRRMGLPSRFDLCHVNWSGHGDDHGSDAQQAARLANRKAAMVDFRQAIHTSFSEHTKELGIEPTDVEGLVEQVCGSLKGRVPVQTVKKLVGLEWDRFRSGKRELLRVLGLPPDFRSADADSTEDSIASLFAAPRPRTPGSSRVSGTSLSASPLSTPSRAGSVSGLPGGDDSPSQLRFHPIPSPHAGEPPLTAQPLAEPAAQARVKPATVTPSAGKVPVKARSVPLPSIPLPPLPQGGHPQPSAGSVRSLGDPGTAVPLPPPPLRAQNARPRMPLPALPVSAPSKASVASASVLPPLPLPPVPFATVVTPQPRTGTDDTRPA